MPNPCAGIMKRSRRPCMVSGVVSTSENRIAPVLRRRRHRAVHTFRWSRPRPAMASAANGPTNASARTSSRRPVAHGTRRSRPRAPITCPNPSALATSQRPDRPPGLAGTKRQPPSFGGGRKGAQLGTAHGPTAPAHGRICPPPERTCPPRGWAGTREPTPAPRRSRVERECPIGGDRLHRPRGKPSAGAPAGSKHPRRRASATRRPRARRPRAGSEAAPWARCARPRATHGPPRPHRLGDGCPGSPVLTRAAATSGARQFPSSGAARSAASMDHHRRPPPRICRGEPARPVGHLGPTTAAPSSTLAGRPAPAIEGAVPGPSGSSRMMVNRLLFEGIRQDVSLGPLEAR